MNVVQPLEALAEAAASATAARARDGVGIGSGRGDDRVMSPIPVMLGVNSDEGLMFVHGAFPVTMPKVFRVFPRVGIFFFACCVGERPTDCHK